MCKKVLTTLGVVWSLFNFDVWAENCTSIDGKGQRDTLKDGGCAPEMMLLPQGQFQMGANDGYDDEKPVHTVTVNSFLMGRYEVTFDEFDAFCEKTRRPKPADNGWNRGKYPVMNVSWHDAVAYTEWLSAQTNQTYRLPTEAEWEYAARGGSSSRYGWGQDMGVNKANCLNSASKDSFEHSAPVGSFTANNYGLYDMIGNVWEWTCSKKTNSYDGSELSCNTEPSAASEHSKFKSVTGTVVLRGGAWNSNIDNCRISNRVRNFKGNWLNHFGFRVVKLINAK
jgi:formylglycine-generating enzyme required for sulfatase activity